MVIRMMISGDDYHLILAATPVVCVVYLVSHWSVSHWSVPNTSLSFYIYVHNAFSLFSPRAAGNAGRVGI